MQQAQTRDVSERISWARAMVFAVGYFFIAAILIGQVPGYIYLQMTAASLEGMERGALGLGVTCIGLFIIIQVIVLLFDPKPVVPPIIFTVLGVPVSIGGLALMLWATLTGCTAKNPTCNQYFPSPNMNIASVLDGKFLWFQQNAVDFVMLGTALLGIGLAMVFYSQLAIREMKNPDRRDPGTTPAIRWMIIAAVFLLIVFMLFYTLFDINGLGYGLVAGRPFFGQKITNTATAIVLGLALILVLGAFALRLHYLMRPVRKRTMSTLYGIGALGFAQLGAILILTWLVAYPLVAWIHTWSFIGLNDYLTVCARKTAIPDSCAFSPQAGYIADGIVSVNFFAMLMAAVWGWKSNRNLVVIGSIVITASIAFATLLIHTGPDELLVALLLTGAMLVLAAVWTSVSRREFAVVGENNLGCLGMWLVVGTCLFIYLAAFAFFSIPLFANETEPNIPFVNGLIVGPHVGPNDQPIITQVDAMVMLIVMGILAAIQFYFLIRNRYRV